MKKTEMVKIWQEKKRISKSIWIFGIF